LTFKDALRHNLLVLRAEPVRAGSALTWSRIMVVPAVLAAVLLLPQSFTVAASNLLRYDLRWGVQGLTVRLPDGQVVTSLKPGHKTRLRYGSQILTISLGAAKQSNGSKPTTTAPKVVLTLLAAINQDRAAHGVAPLSLNAPQSTCSLKHSVHMAQAGHISHDQYPMDVCVAHDTAGENVGVIHGAVAGGVLDLERMMINEGPCPHTKCTSAEREQHGHYLNLVSASFTSVGIGIYSRNGATWLTEDFIR
jgi:Cysteine-rich secretory protein family